jgi:hypothetical protein
VTTTGPTFSRDERWVWDGARWQPALSADGTWRWNGSEWVPVPRPPGVHRLAVTSIICGVTALVTVPGYPIVVGAMATAMKLSVANGSYNEFEASAFLPALCVVLILGVVAIAAGSRGLTQLGRWRGRKNRQGMARAGRVCGIVALCLIPLLLLELAILADS